jgi:DNA polymerase/3'-5' exonuclease PolX
MKHPGKIGSQWIGKKYIHGPRRHLPSRYDQFRQGKTMKSGKRIVWGRVKGTNRWEIQSTLRPKKTVRLRRRDGVTQRYHKVIHLANIVKRALAPLSNRTEIAGSIRRKSTSPDDIDIVLIPKDVEKVKNRIKKIGEIESSGDKSIQARIKGIDTDIYFATPADFESQLMTRTGPFGANIMNRSIAKKNGWKLNQYGLFDKKGRRIASTEKGIYKMLGKTYRLPEHRGEPR